MTYDTWTDENNEFGRSVYVGPGFAMDDNHQSVSRTLYTARISDIKVKRPAFMIIIR